MIVTLSSHHQRIELMTPLEALGRREREALVSSSAAYRRLAPFFHDEHATDRLRGLLRQLDPTGPLPASSRGVWEAVVALVAHGRLWLYEHRLPSIPVAFSEQDYVPLAPPVTQQSQDAWVIFQVVDNATGDPLADITLTVTLPDGSESSHTTNADGTIDIDGVQPGVCRVATDLGSRDLLHTLFFDSISETGSSTAVAAEYPTWRRKKVRDMTPEGKRNAAKEDLAIAVVIQHKVQDGETMASVAERYGMTEEELIAYNFDSDDPAEVQRMLRREVGCSALDPDTGDFVFSSSDHPGILFIPRPFEQGNLQTRFTHVIRTYPPDPYPPPFILSA